MVVKRARPCSSRLTPVGAPIGFSGVFSSVGARVFSAQAFSAREGRRPSKTSAMGFSTTCGLKGFFPGMLCNLNPFDDMKTVAHGQHHGECLSDRLVGQPATGFVVLVPGRSPLRLYEKSMARDVARTSCHDHD